LALHRIQERSRKRDRQRGKEEKQPEGRRGTNKEWPGDGWRRGGDVFKFEALCIIIKGGKSYMYLHLHGDRPL